MRIVQPDAEGIAIAAEALRADEVVAYPTETVYGLGANPFSEVAMKRLFEAKGRPNDSAVLLVISDDAHLREAVEVVSEMAVRYMDAFWPGPLSLLLPKSTRLVEAVTAGREKVCARLTANETARALCEAFGGPITSTSANASGQPPAMCVEDIHLEGVSVAIDGGRLEASPPSTVYDPDEDMILREGVITADAIAAVREA